MKFKNVIKSYSRFEKAFSILLCAVILVSLISIYYQAIPDALKSKKGDQVTYTEAVYGSVQKLNPVYTDFNSVDQDISRLLFCSLSKYNPETGQVEESIATHTLDTGQTIYTFTIKPDIKWHDGTPVTADDVIFTYQTVIQNEKFRNRILKETFTNVEIKKIDESTVEFILNAPNSFFFTSTVNGLLPAHILKDITVANLPNHEFNSKPIGCGPFEFDSIHIAEKEITQVKLKKFNDYFEKGGNITNVIFNIYPDFGSMISGQYNVHGMARVPIYFKDEIQDSRFKLNEYTLPQYTALFMNTNSPFLKKQKARLGIKKAIEKQSILDAVGYKKSIDTPLLELKQDDWRNQSNIQEAMGALFDAGWSLNQEKGFRVNEDGEIFHIRLLARLYDENSKAEEITQKVVSNIEQQLKAIGIKLKIIRLPLAELEGAIMKRDYDLLLYGQNLGYNMDVYSFWHSSQINQNGLNLSNYTNPTADLLIERIRHDFDPTGKEKKLTELAGLFSEDAPAVFLYTPSYYYLVDRQFSGVKAPHLAIPTDRLNNLHLWEAK
ncbi:MAG: ABC transporter substrate-binding protein [Candidatus Peregrinibacteria bacterium]|nr:ABC transporter substrate-binding protein [Candidatus Peregrinibacteria bacterium]MDZ4245095.1 ABC transporter substrate-binding protein [Candidatus Gracilibacteria bacterium]